MALRHTHTYLFESDFKKPGACWPVAACTWFKNVVITDMADFYKAGHMFSSQ